MSIVSQRARAHLPRPSGRTPRWLLVFAVVPILIASSGTAFAYWSSVGTGAADIQAGTAAPLGVSSSALPVADLFPGKTSDLGIVVSNSNPYPVSLTTLTAISVTSSDEASCSGSTYISLPTAVTTGMSGGGYVLPTAISVPAGSTSTAATLTGLITMTTSAPDGCQGKTFTVSLSFTGSQV